ncbi:Predicted transcription regulator, contains HTH domain, MarR family [Bradyrhizobium lablabi]|uniref:Predicted transcription regulator, contains HTH domain, MarR family n=1 Tax=Bradyrhizobium lablabi TaxID=722472 RepID=A0A1M6Q2K6_9BRAD|nr:winged helix DNA-binding protein [Bradyrhizobium lablabi]SHK14361.1 Predicted transcription regulator, contains HTH domain, MarR family [Bradyrhizobium lablabi]
MKRTKIAVKKIAETAKPKKQAAVTERPGAWHLARTETERRLTDFEFGLERLAQAYYRWKAACLAAVCDVPLTGDDVAVLNVVRMGDEPKRLSEIGQLLNRVDVPNLQYATRKLVRAGLIETEGSSSRKETRYRATSTGHSVTEAYAALRAATLPPMLEGLDGWAAKSEMTSSHLDLISSLYAQAAQVAITRRHQP